MKKMIISVFCLPAAIALGLLMNLLVSNPDPFTFQVHLPERADVFPAEQVHPGTFRIDIPWDEFYGHTAANLPQQALVSFGGNLNSEGYLMGVLPEIKVEAYLARGDSTFYYAAVKPEPDWPFGFLAGRVERRGNEFVAYPARSWPLPTVLGVATILLGCLGVGLGNIATRKIA